MKYTLLIGGNQKSTGIASGVIQDNKDKLIEFKAYMARKAVVSIIQWMCGKLVTSIQCLHIQR